MNSTSPYVHWGAVTGDILASPKLLAHELAESEPPLEHYHYSACLYRMPSSTFRVVVIERDGAGERTFTQDYDRPGQVTVAYPRLAQAAFPTPPPLAADDDTCHVDWQNDQGEWQHHHNRYGNLVFTRAEANGAAWCISRAGMAARITHGEQILAVFAAYDPLFAPGPG